MANYAIDAHRFGIEVETTRGTAETSPSKWYPLRGPAEIDYDLDHNEDEGLRGSLAQFPPVAGRKLGMAKIPLYLDPQMAGEFFYSLLDAPTTAQQGGTAAYKHTFVRGSVILPKAYTLFMDRSLGVLKYNHGCVKSISLKGGVSSLVEMDVEMLFKGEASGSIGSPSFPTQRYLGFQQTDFKIAGSSNTEVKDWTLKIDNGAFHHLTLGLSQETQEIQAPKKLEITGGFTIYFANTTERDKFIANTASAIRILMEGSVIASTFKYTVDVNIYAAHYKAFPYREDNGLLASKVTFKGYYSTGDSKDLQVDITNTDTSYPAS